MSWCHHWCLREISCSMEIYSLSSLPVLVKKTACSFHVIYLSSENLARIRPRSGTAPDSRGRHDVSESLESPLIPWQMWAREPISCSISPHTADTPSEPTNSTSNGAWRHSKLECGEIPGAWVPFTLYRHVQYSGMKITNINLAAFPRSWLQTPCFRYWSSFLSKSSSVPLYKFFCTRLQFLLQRTST